jgi:hypothetical protein
MPVTQDGQFVGTHYVNTHAAGCGLPAGAGTCSNRAVHVYGEIGEAVKAMMSACLSSMWEMDRI